MIGVLLVDDHPIVLAGLAALVETDPGLTVLDRCNSYQAAMALEPARTPDVCVIDLHLPDGDGIELANALRSRWPAARFLILTLTADPAAVLRCLGSGLDGYLLKDADPAELLSALRSVAHGSVVLGRGASSPMIDAARALPDPTPFARLDARQREILRLLAQGLGVNQVAAELFLAPKTVRNRITEIVHTLGVASRDDAVALARAATLRSPGSPN